MLLLLQFMWMICDARRRSAAQDTRDLLLVMIMVESLGRPRYAATSESCIVR